MTKSELAQLLSTLEMNYSFFEATEEKEQAWFQVMHNYSYEEVMHNLEIAMGEDRFQKEPPQAYYLIQGLIPISKKTDFEKVIVYCPICKRALNQSEEQKHRERCQSIRYLVKQYKKWTGKDLDKRTLWEMSEEEFQEKYDKFLHYVYEHTTDEQEKMRIGFIFEPPKKEIAKRFINCNV